MGTKITVPPGCTGIDVAERGRKVRYNANRQGVVDIDRDDHARRYLNSGNADHAGARVTSISFGSERMPGLDLFCPSCGFEPWAWRNRHPCPHCGTPLSER